MGGELGGVPPVRFCIDPGGEEFGVMTCDSATGEVLLASGETGVCFLLRSPGLIILVMRSLKDSDRLGEEGSFGDGVPLEECPEFSRAAFADRSFFHFVKNDGLFLIFPLPLERCLNSFPTL